VKNVAETIQKLKEEQDLAVLAHYYVNDDVQALADYVGDSYYLSKVATRVPQRNILFCGVRFMGESAKILNPDKRVVMANDAADCPMAHMADVEKIKMARKEYEDLAVVCYINSTATVKAHSDVCVTSSNAVKIVQKLPQQNIYFIPDQNLGRYVAQFMPEKNFVFGDGFCHIHTDIKAESVKKAKAKDPLAKVLAHPECLADVLALADYVGSTSGIIEFAAESEADSFIICTERGVSYELQKSNESKKFYFTDDNQVCPGMKAITVETVLEAMRTLENEVEVDEAVADKCNHVLNRMLELAE
jgi:quinolinate synthase